MWKDKNDTWCHIHYSDKGSEFEVYGPICPCGHSPSFDTSQLRTPPHIIIIELPHDESVWVAKPSPPNWVDNRVIKKKGRGIMLPYSSGDEQITIGVKGEPTLRQVYPITRIGSPRPKGRFKPPQEKVEPHRDATTPALPTPEERAAWDAQREAGFAALPDPPPVVEVEGEYPRPPTENIDELFLKGEE